MMKYLVIALAVWNVIVFAAFGIDKHKAVKKAWRIPEKTLLLMSILFGGIGATLGGRIFHHKTRKWYFQLSWYLGYLTIAGLFYFVLTYL